MEHEFNKKELLDSLYFSSYVSNCYGLCVDIWRFRQSHHSSEKENEMRSNSAAEYKEMAVDQNRPQTNSVEQSKKAILHLGV